MGPLAAGHNKRCRAACAIATAALAAVSLCSLRADQGAAPSALKAAFLYNFTNFVEWPADAVAPRAALTLCVMGDPPVADALSQAVRGRTTDGHPLVARPLQGDSNVRGCQLLYASGLDDVRATQLIDGLHRSPVFTASDFEDFAQLGGVLQFVVRGGKMRFAVNVDAAQRARLHVSSTLLGLAVIVKDRRTPPSDARQALPIDVHPPAMDIGLHGRFSTAALFGHLE